jgi:hypothetical protein
MMAIDYFVLLPCKVREFVSNAALIEMLKAGDRANAVLQLMRQDPSVDRTKPESEWTFVAQVIGPNGPANTTMKITDLLAKAAPLEKLSVFCRSCPANLRRTDFGCGGVIHYPITASAERWLLSRLPGELNSTSGRLLLNATSEFDGASVDSTRGRKEVYELSAPLERKWGSLFSKKTQVSSSQIIHMLFGIGTMPSTYAKVIACVLGFLRDDFIIDNSSHNKPSMGDDDRTAELKSFLSAAAFAGTNNVDLFVGA